VCGSGTGLQRREADKPFAGASAVVKKALSGEFHRDALAWFGGAPDRHLHALLQHRVVGEQWIGVTSARAGKTPSASASRLIGREKRVFIFIAAVTAPGDLVKKLPRPSVEFKSVVLCCANYRPHEINCCLHSSLAGFDGNGSPANPAIPDDSDRPFSMLLTMAPSVTG